MPEANMWLTGAAILLAALLLLIGLQYAGRLARDRQLGRTTELLRSIRERDSQEHVLLPTEDRRLQELLTEINRMLDASRKVRAEYTRTETSIKKMLANMSHDLKTPLTVILGLTETITRSGTVAEAERERLLLKVHDKGQEMLDLMTKFFDLARLESGDIDLPLSKINLSVSCKDGILFYYETIADKGYEVAIDIPEEPIYIWANAEALDRIIGNLLSNAIRYGGEGGGVVGLTLRTEGDYACVDIWDRGKGIGEQHVEHIFERLYTLEDSRNSRYQGSGLGLTITKRLAEQTGGRIELHSVPYERTVFTIRYPRVYDRLS